MDERIRGLIDKCKADCLAGKDQDKQTIMELLAIDENSPEADYARKRACEATHVTAKDEGAITFTIGIDYAPCPMNCDFCSFGEQWGIITDDTSARYSDDEVVAIARQAVETGFRTIVLRTTELYPHDELVELVRRVRNEIPGMYFIYVNTGELSVEQATDFYNAGAQGAVHMLRLREGKDTRFNPDTRLATINALRESPLRWCTCIDPIGPEHTNEEVADMLVLLHSLKPDGIAIQRRVNVKGTPFGDAGELTPERLSLVEAVVRLCSGGVEGVGSHPCNEESLYCGGRGFNIESGAVPRTGDRVAGAWRGFDFNDALAQLEKAGFHFTPPSREGRPC